jgi:hypothetical protein
MDLLARGKQATIWRDSHTVLWVADQKEAHENVMVGWRLCLEQLRPPHFPRVDRIAPFNGAPCAWMEFVPGSHPVQWNESEASAVLAELKAANVWHRDVRLVNLLQRPTGEWCLLDFGWACDYAHPYPAPWYLGAEGRKSRGVQDDIYAMSVVKRRLSR